MSKKAKSKSSSTSGSAQAWAQPYATAGANSVQGVFNQNQAGLQNLTNLTQGSLVPSMMDKFNGGLPGANAARDYNMGILNGPMGSNPYLQQMIDRTRHDVTNDVNGQFAQSGRYGSGAYTGVLTDRLADAEAGLRYQDYTNEEARRAQAATSLTGANQAELQQALASIGVGAEIPYTGSTSLADSLGALFNGGTEKSSQKGPGLLPGLIGAAGSVGAAFAGSDRRLKKNIVEVGELPNGLTVYDFTYRNDPDQATYRGVMANEVKIKVPAAYIENFDGAGHAGVNYALVGMPLLKLAA